MSKICDAAAPQKKDGRPAYNSLTKLWRLPDITEEVGRKGNVFVKVFFLLVCYWFCDNNLTQLKIRYKNMPAAGTVAKWIANFVFTLMFFVVIGW
jgi:hypothetical protein